MRKRKRKKKKKKKIYYRHSKRFFEYNARAIREKQYLTVTGCAHQEEYTLIFFCLITSTYPLLTYITYMYFILKIYIETYVHVLNVHLTRCLQLYCLLCITILYFYDKIDPIVHINLAYKVLSMLFTSHCDRLCV